jgi:hypothetical protein
MRGARVSTLAALVAGCAAPAPAGPPTGPGPDTTGVPPAAATAVLASCGPDGALDSAVCDPAAGPFSLVIDNPFFPLAVGDRRVYDGEEDGKPVHLEIRVLDETEEVAGVTTRVVEERESEAGALVEVSRNFFAQAPDGTVCYFGEDVDIYEGGVVTRHDGAWRAGGDNQPGIIMPARPATGVKYVQEHAPGVAEDQATVRSMGERVTVPAGSFDDTLATDECSPLEPGQTSAKHYARGEGMVVDGPLRLTSGP